MLDFHLQSYQNRASYEAFHGARQHFLNIYNLNPISAMSNPASPAEVSRTLFMLATAWLGSWPKGSAVGSVPALIRLGELVPPKGWGRGG